MRARVRDFDWGATPLGQMSSWSPSLRTSAGIVLALDYPAIVLWGRELVQLYNDAYAPILGVKHPAALGMRTRDCWPEAWDFNEPIYGRVFRGETVTFSEQLYRLRRRGPDEPAEDVYLDISYVPVTGDDGDVGGVFITMFDVTDQVIGRKVAAERDEFAEQAVRAGERAARILDQMADAHLTMDDAFRIVTANRSAERLLGTSRHELLGRTHWELFPDSVDAEAGRAYRRIVAGSTEEHVHQHYVGEEHDVHLEIDAYRTDEGGVAVFWRDVSMRVRHEVALEKANAEREQRIRELADQALELEITNEQLQEQATELEAQTEELQDRTDEAEQLRFVAESALKDADSSRRRTVDVFESITDPFFIVDRDWNFTYINPAAAGVVGRARGGLIGKNLWEEFREAVGTDYYENAMRAVRERRAVDFEAYYPAPLDIWTAMRIYPLGSAEHPDGVAVYYQNISPRKRAEAALRASEAALRDVFEQAPVAVAVMKGPDHVYSVASPRYVESVGRRAIIGLSVRDAFPELAGSPQFEIMDRVYRTGEPFFAAEQRVKLNGADGTPREHYFNVGYQPLRDGEGTVYGIASVAVDVTPQVQARIETERAREESERARQAAEAANAAKSQFLATMSHELRTPLNAIAGYAELLQLGLHGPVTEQQTEAIARIQRAQRHLLGLINDVLNFAKLEAGRVEYRLQDVSVRETVDELEAVIAPQIREKRIAFDREQCADGRHVIADPDKLQQILVNLLSNAVKFTPPGGSITLHCHDEGPTIAIGVEDTGIGIAADRLEDVFAPFVQIDRRLNAPHEGTGLGLAISRDLARGMNGDLTAESDVGRGSTFTLRLPNVRR
jgi:PAS domain S-box-containing protein